MNTPTRFNEELGGLAPYVEAVVGQSPASSDTARAQNRLVRRLKAAQGSPAASTPPFHWRWAAAAAVLAVVATTLVPFMPGHRDGVAFADVQRRFENFESMRVAMTTEAGGQAVMEMQLVMDSRGRTRLDAGDLFSYVIDPEAGAMLQLFHQSRTAMRILLGPGVEVPDQARLAWLEEIRSFRGKAVALPEKRVIEGHTVRGFRLEAGGMDMRLWATQEGEPVRLELRHGDAERSIPVTRMDFRFDEPIGPGTFALAPPPGYRMMHGTPDRK